MGSEETTSCHPLDRLKMSYNSKQNKGSSNSWNPKEPSNNIEIHGIEVFSEHLENHIHEDVVEDHVADAVIGERAIEALAREAFSPWEDAGIQARSEVFGKTINQRGSEIYDQVVTPGGTSYFNPSAGGVDTFRSDIQNGRNLFMNESNWADSTVDFFETKGCTEVGFVAALGTSLINGGLAAPFIGFLTGKICDLVVPEPTQPGKDRIILDQWRYKPSNPDSLSKDNLVKKSLQDNGLWGGKEDAVV